MAEEGGLNIEVGPRTDPLIWALRRDLLGKNQNVVYIDKDTKSIYELSQESKRHGGLWNLEEQRGKEIIIQGDATSLPLKKGSGGLIFAANLFGSEGYSQLKEGVLGEEKFILPNWDLIAKNWFDVLADQGKVVILETSTPANIMRLTNTFDRQGFKLIAKYERNKIGDIFDNQQFAKATQLTSASDSYAIVFTKPQTLTT